MEKESISSAGEKLVQNGADSIPDEDTSLLECAPNEDKNETDNNVGRNFVSGDHSINSAHFLTDDGSKESGKHKEIKADHLAAFKNFIKIDKRMLPIKLHFFLYALALSAVMSYFPIMFKNIGISASAVGIIYIVCPFAIVLANPLFGWITDKLKRVKLIIIVLIIVQTPLLIGTVFVPSLSSNSRSFSVELSCPLNISYAVSSSEFFTINTNRSLKCQTNCEKCIQLQTAYHSDDVTLCGKDIEMETEHLFNISSTFVKITNISIKGTAVSPKCHENPNDKCQTVCAFEVGNKESDSSEFATYQFWTLLILMVSSMVLATASLALADAACYEALVGKVNQFGKQRVWLTIGWGLGTMITGYLLDLVNPNKDEKADFSYCAYIMLVLIFFDVIALSQATLTKSGESKNILRDVGKIFARPHPIFFATAVLIIGSISAVQWNYQFWYLEELGASKLLLGLSTAVICLAVEVPFMVISGWIVKKIGRDNTLVTSLLSLAIWFICASYIRNPWWILLINLSQGPSYGVFYVAMTSYGKIAAAPGTEATMQTVLGAIFNGLGIGSGSLLGGLGFDLYGGRITFRFVGLFSIGTAVVYKFLTRFVAGESSAVYKGDTDPVCNEGNEKVLKLKFNPSVDQVIIT